MHANDYMDDCEGPSKQGLMMPIHMTSSLSAHEEVGYMQADPVEPEPAMLPGCKQ